MQSITLKQPDDWHTHLRDSECLSRTVADTAARFARAIVMPNLRTPITNLELAKAYQARIMAHIPSGSEFQPLMTLYLNQTVTPQDIREGKKSGLITACKLYPAGATTGSKAGVVEVKNIYPLLEVMQEVNLPLLIHGESIDPTIDIFDRERAFIESTLIDIITQFPELRVVLEHISTEVAVDVIRAAPANVAATITAHHLWINRNDMLAGGIKPHHYCLPVVKQAWDQAALIEAATSGSPKFFLGTDSAPHSIENKQSACGCAGIYTAHAGIELYAEIFEKHHALDKLEGFASTHGAAFYQLPENTNTITLIKNSWEVPEALPFGDKDLKPFQAGNTLHWQLS